MPSITKEFIIESLHIYPTSERETGFNSAMILLLKKLIDAPIAQTATVLSNRDKMQKAFDRFNNSVQFSAMHNSEVDEVISYIASGNKLQSVKSLKEYTGLGLKESKDIIDYFCTL